MCGRYTIRKPFREIAGALNLFLDAVAVEGLTGRFNVAPTQDVPAIRVVADGDSLAAVAMRWGFVPPWSGAKMNPINARDDALLKSAMWREPLRRRRCLLPADGFYEWIKLDAKRKQPIFFRRDGDEPFALAGLFTERDGVTSCAHVTTSPNDVVRPAHDRMPVMLDAAAAARWIDPRATEDELMSLLVPFAGAMSGTPVNPRVNSPRNEGPANVEPE